MNRWMLVPLLGLAIALYLATRNPFVGVAIPYVLAGRKSLASAWWLWTHDPMPTRRFVCCLCQISLAIWQSAAAAFGSLVIFSIVSMITRQQADFGRFFVTMMILMAGVILSIPLTFLAVGIAWRAGIKFWVSPDPRELCHGNFEELASVDPIPPRLNHAVFMLATAIGAPTMTFACIALTWLSFALEKAPPWQFACAMSICLLGPAIAAIIVHVRLSNQLVARSPSECWTWIEPLDPHNTW